MPEPLKPCPFCGDAMKFTETDLTPFGTVVEHSTMVAGMALLTKETP